MAFSSIVKRGCKCGCGKPYTISFDGWFYAHAPQEIKDREGEKSKKRYQANRSRVNLNVLSRKVKLVAKKHDAFKSPAIKPQEQWYQDRRQEMTGCCINCGNGTNVKDDKY